MAVPERAPTRSVREQVSPAEWQKRVDLAACYRLIDLYGMSEMSANHVTTRVPGEDDAFLINPHGMLYDEMTASCFIKMKLDGTVVFNPTEYDVNRAGYVIREIVDKLNAEVVRVLKAPDMRDKLSQQGADPVASSPEDFAAYIRAETAKWAKVVKLSGAKAE